MNTIKQNKTDTAFTLIEILIAVVILAILIAISIPVIAKVKERAMISKSANNLHQIYIATQLYLHENNEKFFDGVENDWFKYGGKWSGNGDANFNSDKPRPLNKYVGDNLEIFRHPSDYKPLDFIQNYSTHFDAYGNDYAFNSIGSPAPPYKAIGGLAGVTFSQIKAPSRTVLYVEAPMMKSGTSRRYKWNWAGGEKGNVCLADGRIELMDLPSSEDDSAYTWKP